MSADGVTYYYEVRGAGPYRGRVYHYDAAGQRELYDYDAAGQRELQDYLGPERDAHAEALDDAVGWLDERDLCGVAGRARPVRGADVSALDLGTLAGLLVRGREVTDLLPPLQDETEFLGRLKALVEDPPRRRRLLIALDRLDQHLRVAAGAEVGP